MDSSIATTPPSTMINGCASPFPPHATPSTAPPGWMMVMVPMFVPTGFMGAVSPPMMTPPIVPFANLGNPGANTTISTAVPMPPSTHAFPGVDATPPPPPAPTRSGKRKAAAHLKNPPASKRAAAAAAAAAALAATSAQGSPSTTATTTTPSSENTAGATTLTTSSGSSNTTGSDESNADSGASVDPATSAQLSAPVSLSPPTSSADNLSVVAGEDGSVAPAQQLAVSPAPGSMFLLPTEFDEAFQEKVRVMWGIKKTPLKFNPSPQPVSLSFGDLDQLDPKEYVVSEKVDGVRYNLVLTMHKDIDGNDVEVAFMMDRKCVKYMVSVLAWREHYEKGCLFDGELCVDPNTGRETYYVFDVIRWNGDNSRPMTYEQRHSIVQRMFHDSHNDNYPNLTPAMARRTRNLQLKDNDVIICNPQIGNMCFKPKPVWDCRDIERIPPLTDAHTDGYILTPIKAPLPSGTFWGQYKWKSHSASTVDLELVATRFAGSADAGVGEQQQQQQWKIALNYVLADSTVRALTQTSASSGNTNTTITSQDPSTGSEENASPSLSPSTSSSTLSTTTISVQDACEQGIIYKPYHGDNATAKVLKAQLVRKPNDLLATTRESSVKCIVECTCKVTEDDTLLCTIVKVRDDKSEPNNRYTIVKTIENLLHPITLADLRRKLTAGTPVAPVPALATVSPRTTKRTSRASKSATTGSTHRTTTSTIVTSSSSPVAVAATDVASSPTATAVMTTSVPVGSSNNNKDTLQLSASDGTSLPLTTVSGTASTDVESVPLRTVPNDSGETTTTTNTASSVDTTPSPHMKPTPISSVPEPGIDAGLATGTKTNSVRSVFAAFSRARPASSHSK